METKKTTPKDMDEYIAGFPEDIQEILKKIRLTIRASAPEAKEAIKYGMPTFTLEGNLVSFGAYKKHIGVYPAPGGDEAFKKELAPYKAEKSTVQFRLDQPIPYDLISKIVRFRVAEILKT